VLLSNDATAVVLTPAVYAATRAAKVEPLPYLFICAFIANAASFVLPISNPANLVVFGARMPHLLAWFELFALPSLLAIVVTYLLLRLTQARALRAEQISATVERPVLSHGGRLAALGIALTAVVLLAVSTLGLDLGAPTFICGAGTTAIVLTLNRQAPWIVLRGVAWGVLPLVAGLFVLVEGLIHTGVIAWLSDVLRDAAAASIVGAAWSAGLIVAFACNLFNNLPVGLIAGAVLAADHVPDKVAAAVLIAVDLGPNLSVTGSLATILWLIALRREGQEVSAWQFLRLGAVIMIPTLVAALAGVTLRP